MRDQPVLSIRGLQHGFRDDTPVLEIDDLAIAPGSFVSIVGPSGCGKSTLLRILAGLIQPRKGTISMFGEALGDRPGHAGFMPQHDRLLPWRRAIDNAVLAQDVVGGDRAASRARAAALFERFGLAGFERAWPSQLSGGMRQRLALLRTFLADRDILLLDEPFGALDAMTRRTMHTWLGEVLESDPRTVVFVTHDVDEALVLSDRVLVLTARPGRIAADVAIDDPRPRPDDHVTSPSFLDRRTLLFEVLEATA